MEQQYQIEKQMKDIINISDASTIAMHAMLLLASTPDKSISNKEISKKLLVSADHLSKVMQRLHNSGLIISERGPKGGYKLAQSPEDINLYRIYQAIDGEIQLKNCLFNSSKCVFNSCIFNNFFLEVREKIKAFFEETTLTQLLVNNITNINKINNIYIKTSNQKQK